MEPSDANLTDTRCMTLYEQSHTAAQDAATLFEQLHVSNVVKMSGKQTKMSN